MEVLPVFSIITRGISDVKCKTTNTITVPAVLRISIVRFYGLIILFTHIQCKWEEQDVFRQLPIKYVALIKIKGWQDIPVSL